MNIVPQITSRRAALGICVMAIVPLLHIVTEYLGTGDRGRTLSKLAVSIICLPILIRGSSAGLRWAALKRSRPPVLLIGGVISAGTLYALLLGAAHLASFSIAALRPETGAWATSAALRIGFAMGLTNFGLWALAFVFPFALEDARFRALEAQPIRSATKARCRRWARRSSGCGTTRRSSRSGTPAISLSTGRWARERGRRSCRGCCCNPWSRTR